MHISFHGNARYFFDYPQWLAAYLATCEAFHIVKKDCTESNIMMGERGRARIKHFAACRFYWYNTDSRCLLPAHSCKLRAWLNLGKQEVYSKREKSEQRSSCFPCSSPVLLFLEKLWCLLCLLWWLQVFNCGAMECYDSYVLYCISYQKELSSISEIPKSHSMILKS